MLKPINSSFKPIFSFFSIIIFYGFPFSLLGMITPIYPEYDVPEITIIRKHELPNSIIGEIYLNKEFIGYTLELPWKENENQVSCIPAKSYYAHKDYSEYLKIRLLNVENRKKVCIHSGNFSSDIRGCILIGFPFGQF